jgi:naphthoate synthase
MRFLQTDADVTSFDGGYGQLILLKWWEKKLVKFSLGRSYLLRMQWDMVNAVIPHAELEDTAYEWAQEILGNHLWLSKCLNLL